MLRAHWQSFCNKVVLSKSPSTPLMRCRNLSFSCELPLALFHSVRFGGVFRCGGFPTNSANFLSAKKMFKWLQKDRGRDLSGACAGLSSESCPACHRTSSDVCGGVGAESVVLRLGSCRPVSNSTSTRLLYAEHLGHPRHHTSRLPASHRSGWFHKQSIARLASESQAAEHGR